MSGLKDVTYDGKAKTQSPVVELEGKILKANADYTASYKNNVNAGTATITVKGAGSYTGSITRSFAIDKAANPIKVRAKPLSVAAGEPASALESCRAC